VWTPGSLSRRTERRSDDSGLQVAGPSAGTLGSQSLSKRYGVLACRIAAV
jgi:hypothetical protein